jgi:hypothetical protein
MTATTRPLRNPKTLRPKDLAKLTVSRSGLSAERMSDWADLNVIRLLNRPPNSTTRRVAKIVDDCRRASQLSEAIKFSSGSDQRAQFIELSKIMEDLNSCLTKYRWHPSVAAHMGPNSTFHVRYEFAVSGDEAAVENRAVRWLMQYIEVVHRIRRCSRPTCRKWFFAVTEHQKYCGVACRKGEASQGESFKKKRKIYMKRYRAEQRERDARAFQAAVRKSK